MLDHPLKSVASVGKMFTSHEDLRFGHCDPSGIAYFPSYLAIMDGVVEKFWRATGFPMHDLISRRRIGTPTVHLDCDFQKPSFFGEPLTFDVSVRRIGRSSLNLVHAISCSGEARWRANQTIVATSLTTHAAIAWPDDIRAALEAFR